MKHLLILVLFMFTGLDPAHANEGIAPCLPDETHVLWFFPLEGKPIAESDESLLYDLPGKGVEWLGYGEGERLGITHGFKGINVDQLEPLGYVYLLQNRKIMRWQVEGKDVNRLLVSWYPPSERYVMSLLTRERYAMPDGSHYDYHMPAHPNGGNCMWWVEADDWDTVFDG